jgi:hypothetical protein
MLQRDGSGVELSGDVGFGASKSSSSLPSPEGIGDGPERVNA